MGRLRAELWRGKTERRGIVIGMEQSATQGLKEKKKSNWKDSMKKNITNTERACSKTISIPTQLTSACQQGWPGCPPGGGEHSGLSPAAH